jgi:hypothetical protein
MDDAQPKARLDWLVELGGAMAPALAAGFAAYQLAPSLGFGGAGAMMVAASACFALGVLAMRAVKPEVRAYPMASFAVDPIAPVEVEEPLLLDTLYEEPLLLDDPLAAPEKDSRVVQLFAHPALPTPGQLKERIDRHLATGTMHVVHEFEGPAPDASDALYAALADLRRSLC